MKSVSKIGLISTCLLLIFSFTAWAQNGNVPEPDDEFNIFLLTIAVLFFGGLLGAAVIGAALTALILFFLSGAIALGAVSSSVAVGLYKKSFSAGFKTFLKAFYIIACTVISVIGLFIINRLFHFDYSSTNVFIAGVVSGIISGYVLAIGTFKIVQHLTKYFTQKLNLHA